MDDGKRPEWVHCVMNYRARRYWCGRPRGFEFAFTGLDHVVASKDSRLQACPNCIEEAVASLNEAAWMEEE